MPERLVDVKRKGAEVLHTFPVTVSRPADDEEAFKQKALEAAAHAKLVPNEELETLNAKIHVSRGGQLTPYGDPLGVLAETKARDAAIIIPILTQGTRSVKIHGHFESPAATRRNSARWRM